VSESLSGPRATGVLRSPRAWRAFGLLVAGAVVVLLVRQLASDWTSLSDRAIRDAMHLDVLPLVAAWVVQTVGWLILVAVWRDMLGPDVEVPARQHLRINAYASLAHVIPGTVWSPASRVAMYRSAGVPGLTVTAALLVEWLLVGLGGLLLYGLAAPRSHASPPQGMAVLAVVALIALVMLHPRAHGRVLRLAAAKLGRSIDVLPEPSVGRLAVWFGLDFVVLVLSGLALHLLMVAVSPAGSVPDAMAAWGLSMAVSNLLVWLPATSIIKEASVVLLLTPLYGSSVVALGVVVAWRLWMVVVQLSWAAMAATWCRLRAPVASDATIG